MMTWTPLLYVSNRNVAGHSVCLCCYCVVILQWRWSERNLTRNNDAYPVGFTLTTMYIANITIPLDEFLNFCHTQSYSDDCWVICRLMYNVKSLYLIM